MQWAPSQVPGQEAVINLEMAQNVSSKLWFCRSTIAAQSHKYYYARGIEPRGTHYLDKPILTAIAELREPDIKSNEVPSIYWSLVIWYYTI